MAFCETRKEYAMKKLRIKLFVVVGVAVLGMCLPNLIIGSPTPGRPVSDSFASSLRGGGCTMMSDPKCEDGFCDSVTVMVAGGEGANNVTPTGSVNCGGTSSCGSYFRWWKACCEE